MRKSKEEAAKTRQRIVKAAATEFRRHGISETGLSELMAAAGLTHGGFYRHFDSKEQLVEEACTASLQDLIEMFRGLGSGKDAQQRVKTIGATYLSKAHRDDPKDGCPLAALSAELARSEKSTRKAMTEAFKQLVDVIADQLAPLPAEPARRKALSLISTMVGALSLARMVSDPELSESILAQARKQLGESLQHR
jgi:TetR/AcrR family transcriptional repressor of nem operon